MKQIPWSANGESGINKYAFSILVFENYQLSFTNFMSCSSVVVDSQFRNQEPGLNHLSMQMRSLSSSITVATAIGVAHVDELTRKVMLLCFVLFEAFASHFRCPYGDVYFFKTADLCGRPIS